MRSVIALWNLALVAALLAGCSVPRPEPVRRTEEHKVTPGGRASATIAVRQKSWYNLALADYVLPVDPKFVARKVLRDTHQAGSVSEPFEKRTSRSGVDLIVHLSAPWTPGADLDLRIEGETPATRKRADTWEYRYTLPAREATNYSARLLLPAESEVLSITPKPTRKVRAVRDGLDLYAWERRMAAKEKVELHAVFKLK